MEEAETRQRYARALQAMCRARGIPATGYALAARLRASGVYVHSNTLEKLLRGERRPRAATIDRVMQGLGASDAELALLPGSERRPSGRHVVSWRDALLRDVDIGRESEEVRRVFEIGLRDEDDICIQRRTTKVGAGGLRAVSFTEGQTGTLRFDLLDTSLLDLQAEVRRLTESGEQPVRAVPHIVQVDPVAQRLGIVVRFSEPIVNESIVWTVRFRWPGMWRSLREEGLSTGSARFSGKPLITKATVEAIAPASGFDDLILVQLSPERGTVEHERVGDQVHARWVLQSVPPEVNYELRSLRHMESADRRDA